MSRDSYECIDRDTCLYINNISGCTVNPAILGRVEGHNDRILQLIRTRGLPLNSFKRWERELFNIKGYFESKVSLGEHVKLSYSLKPVSSPDKNYSIRSLQEIVHPDVEFANEDEELVDFIQLSIIIHNSKTAASKTVILSGTSKPELCWGPKDSGLLFVYSIDENYQYYDAIDLSKGLLIRRDKYKKLN